MSNELGRRDAKAAKFAILMTVLTSFSIGFVLFVFFLVFKENAAYFFTNSKEVAEAVARLSPLLAISLLLNSVQPVLSGELPSASLLCIYTTISAITRKKKDIKKDLFCFVFLILMCVGVANGSGQQGIVAYVNLGSYYLIGLPLGVLLGYVFNLQVEVSFF